MNMRFISHALAWLLATFAGPAFSQITIIPASPQALESVRIHVDGRMLGEWATTMSPEMSGNKITVAVVFSGVSFNEYPITPLETALGQLPAGTYQVEVVKRGSDIYGTPTAVIETIGTTSFVVQPKTGRDVPRDNYTDLWWDPEEPGWGLGIHQHGSNNIFAVWFAYDRDGNAAWYAMPRGTWQLERNYSGPVYRTRGPFFWDGSFNPGSVTVTEVGIAYLSFSSDGIGRFHFTIDGRTGTKRIVRQPF